MKKRFYTGWAYTNGKLIVSFPLALSTKKMHQSFSGLASHLAKRGYIPNTNAKRNKLLEDSKEKHILTYF